MEGKEHPIASRLKQFARAWPVTGEMFNKSVPTGSGENWIIQETLILSDG